MPDRIVIPQLALSATVRLSASAAPSVVVPINNLPLESTRIASLPAVSTVNVSAAGNLMEVSVSPV